MPKTVYNTKPTSREHQTNKKINQLTQGLVFSYFVWILESSTKKLT